MTCNAKEELQQHVQDIENNNRTLIAATVHRVDSKRHNFTELDIVLYVDHTQEEVEKFWNALDFFYDDGYGKLVTGYLWFSDGTWSERREYDGSEWWEHQAVPALPQRPK